MLVAAVALLFLYTSVGILWSAWLSRPPTGPAFWRLTTLLIVAGYAIAAGLRWSGLAGTVPTPGVGAAMALAVSALAVVAFGIVVAVREDAVPATLLAIASVAAAYAVLADEVLLAAAATGWIRVVFLLGMVSVATALGSVVFAMVLAHWYLVEPKLPMAPLKRVIGLFFATEVLKTVLLVAIIAIHYPTWASAPGGLMRSFVLGDALFVGVRAFLGVLSPLGLAWMTWKTLQIRSLQSATGILYAAIVFVLFGEVISLYLSLATGLPF